MKLNRRPAAARGHRSLTGRPPGGSAVLPMAGILMLMGSLVRAEPAKRTLLTIRPLDPVEARSVSYYRQIRPLLADRCAACHSGKTPTAALDTRSVTALLKGGRHGAAVRLFIGYWSERRIWSSRRRDSRHR